MLFWEVWQRFEARQNYSFNIFLKYTTSNPLSYYHSTKIYCLSVCPELPVLIRHLSIKSQTFWQHLRCTIFKTNSKQTHTHTIDENGRLPVENRRTMVMDVRVCASSRKDTTGQASPSSQPNWDSLLPKEQRGRGGTSKAARLIT